MEIKNAQRTRGSVTNALTMLCLLVDIQATGGILTQKPANTVAILGETATIKCISDEDKLVQWESFVNELNKQVLWNGEELIRRACPCSCCRVDVEEPGKYSLNITARNDTAMHYTCTEAGLDSGITATLIVIDSNLTCSGTQNLIDITLVCSIGVYGEWKPKIRWSRSDGLHINDTSASEWKSNRVTSTIKMQLTSDEINYTASVLFDETDRPTVVTATNIPNYTAQLTFSPFKVKEGSGGSGFSWKIGLGVGIPLAVVPATAAIGFLYRNNKQAIQSKKSEAIEGGELPLQDNSM